MKCEGEVALYRFFNIDRSLYGEPFALCAGHFKTQPIPRNCTIHKIAEKSLMPCVRQDGD
jgi:hypothetical protein